MGVIDRMRRHQRKPEARAPREDRPPEGEVAADVLAAIPGMAGEPHHLRGWCPHCHKAQAVDSRSSWVTIPCSHCGAAVTLHA